MLLSRLTEYFVRDRAPAGYRPGVTLEHLRRNLGAPGFQLLGASRARLSLVEPALQLELVERTESQLLMHLVMTEFVLRVPARSAGIARLELHHSGSIRRSGLKCRRRSGDAAVQRAVAVALAQDAALQAALMPLDFKRLLLLRSDSHWEVRLEHMGGSEVVNRMPGFRRYIGISPSQQSALWRALAGLQQLLGEH